MTQFFITTVQIALLYMLHSESGFGNRVSGQDTLCVEHQKISFTQKIDSFIRLSDRRLADFRKRDYYLEWSTRRVTGVTGDSWIQTVI